MSAPYTSACGKSSRHPRRDAPGDPKHPHVRRYIWIVGAQAELKDPQGLVAALLEERRIQRGVVVAATFVAPELGHDATHLCRSQQVYTLELLRKT